MRGSAWTPAGPARRPLPASPAAPRAAASCWGGGHRPAPAAASPRLAAGPEGWPVAKASWERRRPAAALRSPPRPAPDSLTHPTHAHSWPEAMLRSGGRARRATGTHYRGQVARPPPPRPCTRRTHARTQTHAWPLYTRPEYTCAHTHARTQARTVPVHSSRCSPPRNRWAHSGPWHLSASAATLFPSWGPRREEQPPIRPSRPASTASFFFFFLACSEQLGAPQLLTLCDCFFSTIRQKWP
jgi:hypothetical protein